MEAISYFLKAVSSFLETVCLIGLIAVVLLDYLKVRKRGDSRSELIPRSFCPNVSICATSYTVTMASVQPEKPTISEPESHVLVPQAAPQTPESPEMDGPKPVAYCGHCGAGIVSDPVRGVDLLEETYAVYACHACERETLVNQSAS